MASANSYATQYAPSSAQPYLSQANSYATGWMSNIEVPTPSSVVSQSQPLASSGQQPMQRIPGGAPATAKSEAPVQLGPAGVVRRDGLGGILKNDLQNVWPSAAVAQGSSLATEAPAAASRAMSGAVSPAAANSLSGGRSPVSRFPGGAPPSKAPALAMPFGVVRRANGSPASSADSAADEAAARPGGVNRAQMGGANPRARYVDGTSGAAALSQPKFGLAAALVITAVLLLA